MLLFKVPTSSSDHKPTKGELKDRPSRSRDLDGVDVLWSCNNVTSDCKGGGKVVQKWVVAWTRLD